MTNPATPVDQIIQLVTGEHVYIATIRNDEGEHNYTGHVCVGADDPTPIVPGTEYTCWPVEKEASLEDAPTDIQL